jgi:hypothetical protein
MNEMSIQTQNQVSLEEQHINEVVGLIPDVFVTNFSAPEPSTPVSVNDDDSQEYNLKGNNRLINELELKIGSTQLPRF